MAALGRSELQARLVNSASFRELLELVPEVRRGEACEVCALAALVLQRMADAAARHSVCMLQPIAALPTHAPCLPADARGTGRLLRLKLHLLPGPPGAPQVTAAAAAPAPCAAPCAVLCCILLLPRWPSPPLLQRHACLSPPTSLCRPQLLLDPHLHDHVAPLYQAVRNKALTQARRWGVLGLVERAGLGWGLGGGRGRAGGGSHCCCLARLPGHRRWR